MKKKLFRLGEIFQKAHQRYPAFGKRLREAEAFSLWREAVGPLIAKHSRAVSVRNEVLWVEVEHSIWRSELHYRKNQILGVLNQKSPEGDHPIIKDIFFVNPRERPRTLKFRKS